MEKNPENKDRTEKYPLPNNSEYEFDWINGASDSNTIISSSHLHINVNRYLIQRKGQKKFEYDSVGIEEPLNSAVVLIINQSDQIGLVYEWRPIPSEYFWACVRGLSDSQDENSLSSAKREMLEEIGSFKIIESRRIGVIYQNTTFYENPVDLILIKVIEEQKGKLILSDIEEKLDFEFFDETEIFSMIENSSIKDTFTLSAILKYLALKNKD